MASLGPLEGTTPNYGFNLVNFDWVAWSEYEHENWTVVDALLAAFIGINNVSGQWANNTAYTVGQRIVDSTDGTIWEVLIAHTSAAAGTFSDDRIANPTFWETISPYTPIYKGVWANNTLYTKSDFVSDPDRYFIANTSHTSNAAGTVDNDIANWDTLIDLTVWADNLAVTNANVTQNTGNINSNTGQINTHTGQINTNIADITNLQAKKGLNIISKAVDYVILPADLTNYDALIVLVDASVATRTITLPTIANYQDKTILVIAEVDPAGFAVITNKSGGTEWHTSYLNGDFVLVTSDGTKETILDEYVTVRGALALTADISIPATTQKKIFGVNYSVRKNVGGWWDSVTNHRIDVGFKCLLLFDGPLWLASDLLGFFPSVTGVPRINATGTGRINTTSYQLGLANTDTVEAWAYNSDAGAQNVQGAAPENESRLTWKVLRRLR